MIEGGSIVGEICLDDVEPAVAIVIDGIGAHAGLLAASVIEGDPGFDGSFSEGAVVVVVKQQVGRGIAGNIDVGPAVVVEVAGERSEAIVGVGLRDAGRLANVGKSAIPVIVVELTVRSLQAARTAHHRHPLPHAGRGTAGLGRVR